MNIISTKTDFELTNYKSDLSRHAESGKAISWAILLSATIYGSYVYGGKEYLDTHLTPFFHMITLMGAVCICVASLGCGLHLWLLGGKSNTELRKTLIAQHNALVAAIKESDTSIHGMETELGRCAIKLSARGLDCLALGRRILRSLDRRATEIGELLRSGSAVDLIDADELCRKNLIVTSSAMDSLIGSDQIPPLAPEEWIPSLKRIFTEIEAERKKAA